MGCHSCSDSVQHEEYRTPRCRAVERFTPENRIRRLFIQTGSDISAAIQQEFVDPRSCHFEMKLEAQSHWMFKGLNGASLAPG